MDNKHGAIDPSEALTAVNSFFCNHDSKEIVNLGAKFTPTDSVAGDLRLSHHASEASWRLMESSDTVTILEASKFALSFFDRLDEAAAFLAGHHGGAGVPSSMGVEARRMLVSQTADLEPVLRPLVNSPAYKEIRKDLGHVVSSGGRGGVNTFEQARQFLAAVSLVLNEAVL